MGYKQLFFDTGRQIRCAERISGTRKAGYPIPSGTGNPAVPPLLTANLLFSQLP